MAAKIQLRSGTVIDAEDPKMHELPEWCPHCKTFYYFNHVCPQQVSFERNKTFELSYKGFFDGEE